MARKPKKVSVVSNSKPEAEQLSDRQRRILQVIRDAVVLRGYPPSIREIGDAAGLQSTSSVAYQLKELERKGFLRRDPNKPRAVDVRAIPGEELKKDRYSRQRSEGTYGHRHRPVNCRSR